MGTTHTDAERLLALRTPLIERGKRVPALERSIRAHKVEATALHALLRSAHLAEAALIDHRDHATTDLAIARLETQLVQERLRTAEIHRAAALDLAQVNHVTQNEHLVQLRQRCADLKTQLQQTSSQHENNLENPICQLRKQLEHVTTQRDEWRQKANNDEPHLSNFNTEHAKLRCAKALLGTERALSASLRKQLEDAKRDAVNPEKQPDKPPKSSEPTGNTPTKALEREKKTSAALRDKLKKAERERSQATSEQRSLRKKSVSLETQLKEALQRATTAEERTAELERQPVPSAPNTFAATRNLLMSPAPLASRKMPVPDAASESRSRFTDTLPLSMQNDRSVALDDEEDNEVTPQQSKPPPTPRSKRKRGDVKRWASKRKVGSRAKADEQAKYHARPKRGDQENEVKTAGEKKDATKKTAPYSESVPLPAPSAPSGTPSRKPRRPTRKALDGSTATVGNDVVNGNVEETQEVRRRLRSRKPVSYNYDEQGRDIVGAQPGFEVDTKALRKLPTKRKAGQRSPKPSVVTRLDFDDGDANELVDSEPVRKRRMRRETVRKRIPVSRKVGK